jgi:glycosyltransferase involved in cell wall biosynthesis
MSGAEVWDLSDSEVVWDNPSWLFCSSTQNRIPLVAMLRVRNEELILGDTLAHLSTFADLIVAYDDASDDLTAEILRSHPKVGLVIRNTRWLGGSDARLFAETRHRGLLLQEARKRWCFRWCICCDADERYVGDLRGFVLENAATDEVNAVRISLFDAYMTSDDCEPFRRNQQLLDFRQYFGPECRNILMLWRDTPDVIFRGLDSREPCVPGRVVVRFRCQHYGKSLSLEHWEQTCQYYVEHFPYDPYGKKWQARKGKAIHELSDFGRPLYLWGEQLFSNSVTDFL